MVKQYKYFRKMPSLFYLQTLNLYGHMGALVLQSSIYKPPSSAVDIADNWLIR